MFKYTSIPLNEFLERSGQTLWVSTEFMQDTHNYLQNTYKVRTGPISDEDSKVWQEVYTKTKEIDIEETKLKYGIQFVRDEWYQPPYAEPDCGVNFF